MMRIIRKTIYTVVAVAALLTVAACGAKEPAEHSNGAGEAITVHEIVAD